MNGRLGYWRIAFGAFLVVLILAGLRVDQATATVKKGPNHGSKAQFKFVCETFGGIFIDTGDGNTWCQYPNGTQWLCDDNGNDCHIILREIPTREDGGLTGGVLLGDSPQSAPGRAYDIVGPTTPSVFLAGSAAPLADDAVAAESLVAFVSGPAAEPVNDAEAVAAPVAARIAIEPTDAGATPVEPFAAATGGPALDKAAFKAGCEQGGHSYVENLDGSFQCNLSGGGTIKCANTTSPCTSIPAPDKQPDDNRNPVGDIGDGGVVAPSDPTPPVADPVTGPITDPILEPVVAPIVEPVVAPIVEPVVEPILAPVAEPALADPQGFVTIEDEQP